MSTKPNGNLNNKPTHTHRRGEVAFTEPRRQRKESNAESARRLNTKTPATGSKLSSRTRLPRNDDHSRLKGRVSGTERAGAMQGFKPFESASTKTFAPKPRKISHSPGNHQP
ncbi:hypothetical protein KC19_3G029200 [Ceratodon purpureus]|uniref:Uncharacterized protein n=1 Tax=Ceratodon purpureus TaxID=3225 RepID=A0A8T0IHW2_CERPU|nr:hypothetical protein KC19_3G029200 [Ceratodon purpureus]